MNYELAKKLKDAGFPQDFNVMEPDWIWEEDTTLSQRIEDTGINKLKIKLPMLSELIEACGDDFESLNKTKKGWEAWGTYWCCDEHGEGKKIENGPTPDVAMAKLWLALNKKSSI